MSDINSEVIENTLINLGCTPNLGGFRLIVDSVKYYNKYSKITKELYPILSKKYNISICSIDRRIRYSVVKMINNNYPYLKRVIPNNGKITVKKFISTLSFKLERGLIK